MKRKVAASKQFKIFDFSLLLTAFLKLVTKSDKDALALLGKRKMKSWMGIVIRLTGTKHM